MPAKPPATRRTVRSSARARKPAPVRTKPSRAGAARARPRADAPDAIAMLRDDHRQVSALFAQFAKLGSDGARKAALVEKICRELTVHAKVEEEIFYPAARTVLEDAALVDEADVEHAAAKALIGDLARMNPGDDHYDAKVTVLGEYVRHHVEEEQDRMFPKLRRSKLDLRMLGERMTVRKRELEAVLANPSAVDDAVRSFVPVV
ncbi:MAG: hemerythrin domain-containing protein [Betaproteobacteria bacterium]